MVRAGDASLWVVGLHLIADLEAADGLAATGGGDLRVGAEGVGRAAGEVFGVGRVALDRLRAIEGLLALGYALLDLLAGGDDVFGLFAGLDYVRSDLGYLCGAMEGLAGLAQQLTAGDDLGI